MERIDVPVFSNNDNQKMLVAIKECISLAKGCEPTNEEVWKFCKAFILLLFDMDCAESVNRALSASLIKCNSPENPILVWSRLVEYAGQCNQAAASVSKENIDRNIRDLFSKNNIIQLPPDPITAIDLFIPTIALIGAWKEDNEFDRKMIEQISGMEYSEFEAKARTMLSQNSEYLQLMNGNWKVCHKEELLNQCKNKLFDDSIGKLLEAVESILRQKSKCVASKMPYFIPVSGEYDNSLELRGNLVKSLCWVKKNLSELSQCNQEKIENNIYTLVSTLLQDAKWITWTSLRDCLQNLAELSPEAFLKEAERGIINNPTEIVNLFPPKSGELSGINYISNLLWALEILAWSPEYLVHSISVLGLLEALPYERTNWTNTPINSIVSILLPWYPQTMADLEKRKNALKCLKTDNPCVFWSTLKKLLPNKTRSTSGNPRPKYLKLEIPEEVKVTNAEAHECYLPMLDEYSEVRPRALNTRLSLEPEYFCSLIELFYKERNGEKREIELNKSLSDRLYEILFQFKVIPGIDWNGNFDAKRFDYWMKTVKTWSRDNDRYEVAMHTVGSGLSYAELDEDKLPQTAIIEELNRVENEELRRGYYLGIINQRGVHWIDPEGKPELELAEDYENKANIAESRGYSRYAGILRGVADEFKREAKSNILEAKNGDDE